MKYVFVSVLLALSACNTPGPHFRDLPATRISVDGSVFDVRVRDELAEALRINLEYAPRLGRISQRGARAMAMVSGCEVTEIRGDQTLVTGILDCAIAGPRRVAVPQTTGQYDCIRVDRWEGGGIGGVYEEYECDPY